MGNIINSSSPTSTNNFSNLLTFFLGDESPSKGTNSNQTTDLLTHEHDHLPDPLLFTKELSEECKGFWEAVTKDYHNFSNWTTLLQFITDSEVKSVSDRKLKNIQYNCNYDMIKEAQHFSFYGGILITRGGGVKT